MILTGDYHTHTPYSHGKNSVMENTLAAKEKGMKQIGITDHGFNHVIFGLKRKELPSLRADCTEAEKATGVKVFMGMESNLTSINGDTDMKQSDLQYFDLYLCGLHEVLWYKGIKDFYYLVAKNYMAYKLGKKPAQKVIDLTTKAYINAIKNNPIDIITHINYKCFCNLTEVAKCCADYGTYIEINTKKYHITPEELNEIAETGVRFVIDSDAHSADRVGDTKIAEELLSDASVPLDRIDNIDGRTPCFRFAEYKKKNL
ncbi:MAG: PHP domain-containing protein [Clostridia bacterium]|nr:PHP domain-containing protein [Clostridia bacterium]